MIDIFFLTPCFKERVWGSQKLSQAFNYSLPTGKIGECWGISTHKNGETYIKDGPFSNLTLEVLWRQEPQLFDHPRFSRFPLLIKILDANESLAVQVHPDDDFALLHEDDLGKTECWYVIDAQPDAEIILGHKATTTDELAQMIDLKQWEKLLNYVPVKNGDFFYIPSGTIHALGKGILVLETQQNSDTTYRIHDFDRLHKNGEEIPLDLAKSLAVTTVPDAFKETVYHEDKQASHSLTTFVDNAFFKVQKWEIDGYLGFTKEEPYLLCSVISGSGTIILLENQSTHSLRLGDHFIIPATVTSWSLNGKLTLIVSSPGNLYQ